jgi:GntR family transcriptional regulator
MQFLVAPADPLPIYRQLMRQVTDAVAAGRLAPGEQLPSHRELSEQLVIAPLTVKKAYDELEALGYVTSQRGRGTFVADPLPATVARDEAAQLAELARTLLARAYLAGHDLADVVTLLEAADRALHTDPPVPVPR